MLFGVYSILDTTRTNNTTSDNYYDKVVELSSLLQHTNRANATNALSQASLSPKPIPLLIKSRKRPELIQGQTFQIRA
jgi:hypothetical protein